MLPSAIRARVTMLLLCFCVALAGGCATTDATDQLRASLESGPLTLTLTPEKETLAPGEAAIITLVVSNRSDRPAEVPVPDHQSVQFFVKRADGGAPDLVQHTPVYSPLAPVGGRQVLEPGESLSRPFVFTRLSFERGVWGMIAILDDPQSPTPVRTYAQPLTLTVSGERVLLQRTVDGLISQETAERLAREHWGRPEALAMSRQVRDEKGFVQWWVTLSDGDEVRAWFVNPYLGAVWKEAEPFEPETESAVAPARPAAARRARVQ